FAAPVMAVASDGGPCSIIGSMRTAAPAGAALVNGTLAHGLDFDDTHAVSITHASAVVVPTALAVAESEGVSGRDVVTAIGAGHAGIVAATLAAGGVSGPASVLEGRFGFYRTFVGTAPLAEVFETLGREWETPRIGFKPYPCCHLNHAYIDCALRLREEHRVDPDAIVDIECHVPTGEVPIVCEPRRGGWRYGSRTAASSRRASRTAGAGPRVRC